LAVIWTAFIIYALVSEQSKIPRFPGLAEPGVDKLIHIILFGVEAGLLAFMVPKTEKRKFWIPILAWCFILGGGLEVVQHVWIEGRSGDVLDLLADMIGGALGMAAVRFLWR
tara:strand:- start:665 stop:1000 length:336 start_codon:yes stop_codon:yes gene_type:complete